ncbi:hypothetical protein GCM10027416_04430 [Okibacterium endophyticum]
MRDRSGTVRLASVLGCRDRPGTGSRAVFPGNCTGTVMPEVCGDGMRVSPLCKRVASQSET